ncbi:ABC transporter ATP-binding protein [Bacillus cereus]|uniref:ATP-binding cassette domain-containing protein n=1 Tax=Bacillus TaxID=1386 RepID=UPI0005CED81B|nr:ABC transporter ATP-binding protein [Bacillus cereus]MDR4154438.1 ABC transporter ATP-binding protein [Bacillus cereus]MEB9933845.1 ABC transporter ATP-binding protein [Bacillus cereus]MEB9955782.1 ABC transporter ATP-binding protein [Bacillus cereus]HDR4911439.1 ABC transporter ATP-binding protein [Bacillus cereus]HDR4915566.1 ABC transporter ATP-binding protein [Bacillus cereus]
MNNNIVLSVEDLSKTYIGDGFKVNALDNISFQLHRGEMIAIMGTSGSGKSTLLNILGALDKPTLGSIKLNGKHVKDIFIEPSASLYRQENIGFIFQSFNLLKDLSVEENISLPLILKNVNKREITEKSNEIMNLLGLVKWKKHRPTQLSGGQQQRVAIGRAIITAPPIVLADEPTGNLDFNTSSEILHILVDMKRKFNQSILIVTHDANVATYADRVLFFHDGRIVDEYKCGDYDSLDDILEKFKKITERKDI